MEVTNTPETDNPYTKSLLAPDIWDGLTITFSFPTLVQYVGYSSDDEILTGFSPFSALQRAAVRQILEQISELTNLVFVEMSGFDAGDATLRFGGTNVTDTAFAFLPSTDQTGGDVWVSSAADMLDPKPGDYAYFTLMHEIGHALGLVHPHEGEFAPAMPEDRDWMPYTVMSYRSYEGSSLDGFSNADDGFAQTFMMEDIAALQAAYGANYNTNSGDTLYFVDVNNGELYVAGVTEPSPSTNTVFRTIWDGGGNDTYDFANYTGEHTSGLIIDLAPGGWTAISRQQEASLGDGNSPPGEIANAHLVDGDLRSIIENARGSTRADIIYGNQVANRLDGYIGDDELYGLGGDDHLIGGDGSDEIYGGDGDDIIESWAGLNKLYGDAGDDVITAGWQSDWLYGGTGSDILRGEGAVDKLYGGEGNDFLYGGDREDQLFGDEGDDLLDGGAHSDDLDGGTGADRMLGGSGNDYYVVDNIGDVIVELAGEGTDRVDSSVNFVLPDYVENGRLIESDATILTGNDLDNGLVGNSQNNVLDGGLGADLMSGFAGDDIYYVDNAEDDVREVAGGGTDTVYASASFALHREFTYISYTGASAKPRTVLPAEVEFLILTGTANLRATGNELGNNITGNSGNNVIKGAEGDDTLDGGEGLDTAAFTGLRSEYTITLLTGGSLEVSGTDGTDILVNIERLKFNDVTIDAPVGFSQTGTSSAETLTGSDDVIDLLYGLGGNDILEGLSGDDTLDGGGGNDEMRGGLGDDTYFANLSGDVIIEGAGEGFDRVYASFNIKAYPLRYANIESFALTGAANDLVGNDGNNELIGNPDIRSRLYGKDGADSLIGGNANDKLDGGAGADDMRGGLGDDFYIVDDAGDMVVELADQGTDEVRAKVDYALPDHVENLRLSGIATSGTGNELDNLIRAGALAVTLSGEGGVDKLFGSTQADTLHGGDGNDVLQGKAGNDRLFGDAGDDTLIGGGGVDRLRGKSGDDVLKGGTGADLLFGDTDDDFLYGDGQDDVLDGGAGADKLYGGLDNDTLIGGADRDVLTGDAGADVFAFAETHFAGLTANTADRITDFKSFQGDKIDLSMVDAILGGDDDAFAFIADAAFSGTAGELRWEQDGGNTMIYMDVDGDAQADYAIRLDGTLNLAEADFIL